MGYPHQAREFVGSNADKQVQVGFLRHSCQPHDKKEGNSIAKGIREVIIMVIKWNVYSGSQTQLWKDNRLIDQPLVTKAIAIVDDNMAQLKIREYWREGVGWNWETLDRYLTPTTLLQLASTPLTKSPPRRTRSVGSTQLMACTSSYEEDQRWKWKPIWKLQVPKKKRNFMSVVAREKLLTNHERYRRHMSTEDAYCSRIKEVWTRLVPTSLRANFFHWWLQVWLQTNLQRKEMLNIDHEWVTTFAMTAWWAWKWRNNHIFRD
ncbi:hypothetical protein V2J09_003969 [Rumex salicifolius]